MTNYKKMYELTSKAISDALAILSSDPQREDAKEWVQFLLEQAQIRANYVYRVTADNIPYFLRRYARLSAYTGIGGLISVRTKSSSDTL